MAFSKSKKYPRRHQLISRCTKAFSHPARIEILWKLALEGRCNVNRLHGGHPISRSSLSNHLGGLRNLNWIKWDEAYPYTYYDVECIELSKGLDELIGFLLELKKLLEERSRSDNAPKG